MLKGGIKEISSRGILIIHFNASMFTDFDLELIHPNNTAIYIIPALQRHEENGFNLTSVNFTWFVQSYLNKTLTIKLDFFQPISISPLLT